MSIGLACKLFGSSNERRIKSYFPRVAMLRRLDTVVTALSKAGGHHLSVTERHCPAYCSTG
jgi:hypothetical protein